MWVSFKSASSQVIALIVRWATGGNAELESSKVAELRLGKSVLPVKIYVTQK
jgi:hypothetical protein